MQWSDRHPIPEREPWTDEERAGIKRRIVAGLLLILAALVVYLVGSYVHV